MGTSSRYPCARERWALVLPATDLPMAEAMLVVGPLLDLCELVPLLLLALLRPEGTRT